MEAHEVEISEFIGYLSFEKRYSPHTTRAYHQDLREFYFYIGSEFKTNSIRQVTLRMVRAYMAHLSSAGMGNKTIHRKISSIQSYCKYLLKNGQIDKDPLQRIQKPKLSKKLPETLDQITLERLFERLSEGVGWENSITRIIISILYCTGIRRAEIQGLKINDLDLSKRQLKVFGKRSKERMIPITEFLKKEILLYLSQRELIQGAQHEPSLLIDQKAQALTSVKIYSIVRSALSMVTTADKKSPHMLRHAFASHLLDEGAELTAVKELLGHTSLAATQIYTHHSIERLRTIYKNKHPKA
jgi:integrase/recombinase XerC